jgi:hypothetical protein
MAPSLIACVRWSLCGVESEVWPLLLVCGGLSRSPQTASSGDKLTTTRQTHHQLIKMAAEQRKLLGIARLTNQTSHTTNINHRAAHGRAAYERTGHSSSSSVYH